MNKNDFEPNFQRRGKIIGVMGGSESHLELSDPLGKLIARMGFHLLTGAGGGIMEEVSKSFFNFQDRSGVVIGIVRADPKRVKKQDSPQRDYAPKRKVNRWVEVPIYTHLRISDKTWDSRNHINVLTSDVVVALPGKRGTKSEVELALEYRVPTIFFLGSGTIHKNPAAHFTANYPNSPAKIAETLKEIEVAIRTFLS